MAEEVKTPENVRISQPAAAAEDACQWFLGKASFCDKLKKEVRCDGNVVKCPFCR